MSESQLEWDIGRYWHYTLEDRFAVRYEVIGSRKQSVNDVQRPCHLVAVSTGRMNNISYTYPPFYFDIEVMNVTKRELGVVTDNEIEMTLTLQPDANGAYVPSNFDEEGVRSTTRFVGKETVKIDDNTYENCDKIILQEGEEERTYWYSQKIQNHVKIASNDGAFSMQLRESGHEDRIVDSIYERLVNMSKSHERRQVLRSIRALIDLGEIIRPTRRSDLLLDLSER